MSRYECFSGGAADRIDNPLRWFMVLTLSLLMGCGSSNGKDAPIFGSEGIITSSRVTGTTGEKNFADNALIVNDARNFSTATSAVVSTQPIQPSVTGPSWGVEMSISRIWSWLRWTFSSNE